MTVNLKEMFYRAVVTLMILTDVCRGTDPPKSYGSSVPNDNNYQNIYDAEIQRPLAVFTEKPINVADFVLVPVVQVPSADLRIVYRPQIDSVSKTEPIVMCKSSTKSFEATPALQVPLQQPFYLYDERTLIPFPKTVTILHGGYRMSILVAVVVAPVPVGVLKSGPVYVTTLYAIPVGPVQLPTTVPVSYVPWTPYPSPAKNSQPDTPSPPSYSSPPKSPPSYSSPPSPPAYSGPPSPPSYSGPSPPPSYSGPPSPPSYSGPPSPPSYSGPPSPPSYSEPPSSSSYSGPPSPSSYSGPPSPSSYSPPQKPLIYPAPSSPPSYSAPASSPSYSAPPSPPSYSATPSPPSYPKPQSPPSYPAPSLPSGLYKRPAPPPPPPSYSQPPVVYSQPAPSSPTYYQSYSEDYPPGKLYTHFVASPPFYNSKESPVLNQLREESEKNRNKYASPSYSYQYQTIIA